MKKLERRFKTVKQSCGEQAATYDYSLNAKGADQWLSNGNKFTNRKQRSNEGDFYIEKEQQLLLK